MNTDLPIFPLPANLGESVRRTLRYEPEVTDIGFGSQPAMPVRTTTQERIEITCIAPDADTLDAVEGFVTRLRGRYSAFWLNTEQDAALEPQLLLVRFASDEIEYEFEADNHARIRFSIVELPEEYAAPNALAIRRPVYLYRITRRYGVRDIYSLHLTSHDTPIRSGTVTWQPVPIDHGGLSVSSEGDSDKLSLELFAWDGNPFEDWLPIHIGQPTGIVLSLAHIDAATALVLEAPQVLFRGIIASVARQGYLLKANAVSPLHYADKRVPRFFLQTRCNYQLFDGSTCRVPAASHRLAGTIAAIDTESGSVEFESATLTEKPENWLAGGYIEIGTAPHVEVRTIRYTESLSETRHRLFLNASLRTSKAGDVGSAWPGCDRTPDCCKQRFNNFVNYGGHPFIPYDNPTLKAMPLETPASGGGKK